MHRDRFLSERVSAGQRCAGAGRAERRPARCGFGAPTAAGHDWEFYRKERVLRCACMKWRMVLVVQNQDIGLTGEAIRERC
jgi:hypothetical protein